MLEVRMMDDGAHSGSMLLDSKKLRRFTDIEPSIISINAAFRPERKRVEQFIEKTYASAFGAKIEAHYPTLISAQDKFGNILAAAGFRFAHSGRLFLENYLDAPIQVCCGDRGIAAPRNQIAEVGNLSSTGGGASIFLFLALASHLEQCGVTIAAVTATKRLRRIFRTVRFHSVALAEAGASKLSDGADSWGAYYESEPLVLAGEVSVGRENLERLYAQAPIQHMIPRLHHDCSKDH